MKDVRQELENAVWVAGQLFERGKVSGSSANLSVRVGDVIFITASGTCFGSLTVQDFTQVNLEGRVTWGPKPSKELPLHLALYHKDEKIGAVIHTHSFYSTIWSCLRHEDERDVIPSYTPYLAMKVGKIGLVPYAPPGSEELFALFRARVNDSDGFLLANHGPVVPGSDVLNAFYGLEELEESARVAWTLRNEKSALRI